VRKAALPAGLAKDIVMWRKFAVDTKPQAFVFASERKTPLAKENVWRRNILPRFERAGLEWANFQVMRRTHASIMKQLGVDPKWVADQLGHSLDVSQNIYTQVPVEQRLEALHQMEKALVM
jgi:site-specific recombinase XerD